MSMFLLNEVILEWISRLIGSNLIEKQHFHPLKLIKLLISRLNQLISRFQISCQVKIIFLYGRIIPCTLHNFSRNQCLSVYFIFSFPFLQ